jgi:molybdenum cofactor biosynthesis protein B
MGVRPHTGVTLETIGCAIITVSDTRTEDDDESGWVVRELLEDAGHPVQSYAIVPDDPIAIRTAVGGALERDDVLAVVVNGGTGIAPRDITIESLAKLWVKELPGFGELFRMLSFEEIGAAAFLSRATAGVVAGKFVAVLPGSPAACRLGMERLIVPELGHVGALLGAS